MKLKIFFPLYALWCASWLIHGIIVDSTIIMVVQSIGLGIAIFGTVVTMAEKS